MPGPAQKSLIPNSASAAISIRIVPDQSLDDIVAKLKTHLEKSFRSLRTQNKLSVREVAQLCSLSRLTSSSPAGRDQSCRRLGELHRRGLADGDFAARADAA